MFLGDTQGSSGNLYKDFVLLRQSNPLKSFPLLQFGSADVGLWNADKMQTDAALCSLSFCPTNKENKHIRSAECTIFYTTVNTQCGIFFKTVMFVQHFCDKPSYSKPNPIIFRFTEMTAKLLYQLKNTQLSVPTLRSDSDSFRHLPFYAVIKLCGSVLWVNN